MRKTTVAGIVFTVLLAAALPAAAADCNVNSVEDGADVAGGASPDCNGNQIPDECEVLPIQFGVRHEIGVAADLPLSLALGDFDGDGTSDILTGSQGADGSSSISLFTGIGDRTFAPARNFPAGSRLLSVTGADLDGDGDLDVATANLTVILILRNDGNGGFSVPVEIPASGSARFITAGDLNGDDLPELITADLQNDTLSVFANNGGAFAAPLALPAGDAPTGVAAVDLDGDRDLDLAASLRNAGKVAVLQNDGAGAFAAPVPHDLGDSRHRPFAVLPGDFDADGRPDLLAAAFSGAVLLGNDGRGGFGAGLVYDGPLYVAASGDLDSDGNLDIFLAPVDEPAVHVLRNLGGARFRNEGAVYAGAYLRAAAIGHLDRDAELDIVSLGTSEAAVKVLWNGDTSGLTLSSATVAVTQEPHSATLGDANGDGRLDVLTANGYYGTASVLLGRGDGTLAAPVHYPVEDGHLISITAGDFDLDLDLDMAVANLSGSQLSVLLNRGDGSYGEAVTYDVGPGPFLVIAAELNGDGLLDLAMANEQGGGVTLLFNLGGGTFGGRLDLRTGFRPVAVAAADLDRDGNVDLAVANSTAASVTVLLGAGGGRFAPGVDYALPGSPLHIAPGDFDGDRNLDLAVARGEAMDVVILLGGGDGTFRPGSAFPIGQVPYSVTATDLDGDGDLDLITSNQAADTITLLLGNGDATFRPVPELAVGDEPRFALAGDLESDGDLDLVVSNHFSQDLTVLLNLTPAAFQGDYLETVCTPLDFHKVSVRARGPGIVTGLTKYILPARDDPALLPALFQNASRHELHQDFLSSVFPDRFPGLTQEEYDRLTGRRATRSYYAGVISRLRDTMAGGPKTGGPAYGFSVLVDGSTPQERLTLAEVRAVREELRASFTLEPLGYFPDNREARADAAAWGDPGFPVYLEGGEAPAAFQAYTLGVGYGRVRLLDEESLAAANASGEISFQSILVLDQAPRDIEGVVSGVITGGPQGELSHLAVRAARRRTPNAYLEDAAAVFAPWAGKLVRLEVLETDYAVAEASPQEAEAWWASHRPRLGALPALDPEYAELPSLAEMDLGEGPPPPAARFGGKAANLARLQRILAGSPFESYREAGFAIPMRHYLDFLRTNVIPSSLDPERQVTYEEHLRELFSAPAFQSDSSVRAAALRNFREYARANGRVDPAFLGLLLERAAAVFPSRDTMLRFRSSSNVEDALEFNGAGLYESTSACPADDLDAGGAGPSRCDRGEDDERGLARALKLVWTSLYTFRGHEERAYYGIPEERVAMGILVTQAFRDERANGVAFTGNISNPLDPRYVVTAQVGDLSVVSPAPGLLAEKDVLEIAGGEVARIIRPAVGSSLLPPGVWVLSDDELRELGRLMSFIDRNFPLELGTHSRREVLLDMEFKVDAGGSLAIKQVRPFLHSVPAPPAPTFTLEVPAGTSACGVFALAGAARGPREEYELKSMVQFRSGSVSLPTAAESFGGDLVEEVVIGPGREIARPVSSGLFRVARSPAAGGVIAYSFKYEQEFTLPGGGILRLELAAPIVFRARGEEPLVGLQALNDGFFTRRPGTEAFQARLDGVPLVRYGSCDNATLPRWEIDATAEDGTSLHLVERFLPVPTSDPVGTGPASLVRAEVGLGGEGRRVVTDYWNLVYSAARHNRDPRYWAVFEPPAAMEGIEAPIRAVELRFQMPPGGGMATASVAYLGADFQVLGSSPVASYRKEEAPAAGDALFRRGEVNVDGLLDLTDALSILTYLFLNGAAPACLKSADTDDSGTLNVTDGVYLLNYLFLLGSPPAEPFPDCGVDPSEDTLGCGRHANCSR